MGSPVSAVIYLYMESFEEQAITTSSHEPRIWKRYVDDTFTILDRENVDDFLQHLKKKAAFHPLYHGDRERQPTRLPRYLSFKRTWRPPHNQRIQEAHAHRWTLSIWFTPPSISKTQYGVVYRILYECSKVYIGETEDLCKTELRSTIETSNSPLPRPPPFQSIPTTPNTSHSETK